MRAEDGRLDPSLSLGIAGRFHPATYTQKACVICAMWSVYGMQGGPATIRLRFPMPLHMVFGDIHQAGVEGGVTIRAINSPGG
jgi:hypothetical protein